MQKKWIMRLDGKDYKSVDGEAQVKLSVKDKKDLGDAKSVLVTVEPVE